MALDIVAVDKESCQTTFLTLAFMPKTPMLYYIQFEGRKEILRMNDFGTSKILH